MALRQALRSTSQNRSGSMQSGRGRDGEGLANALGWFSIGLGVAQLAAPGRVARLIGVEDDEKSTATMRAIGVREIAAGIGLLMRPRPAEFAWGRVAGDAMDIGLMGKALTNDDNARGRATAATAALLGVAAVDVIAARRLTSARRSRTSTRAARDHGIRVRKSITVDRPPDEVYRFWRNLQNLPRFMDHVQEVQETGDRRSHWVAKAPAGMSVEWDAEITEDRPNELLAWRSVQGADVDNSGVVRFRAAPGGRGTELHVDLHYDPPAGKLGAIVAKLFGEEPGQQVADDLRRFKQVLETGEVLYSDASLFRGPHPAQPPREQQVPRTDREQRIVVERSADAAATTSSNRDRTSTTARSRDRETRPQPGA